MKTMSRLHLYPHKEPNGRAYIVAERRALKVLAKKLEQTADGAVGFDKITLYSSDGHPYELMIISDISEEEWQELDVPSSKKSDPSKLETVKIVDEMSVQSTILS